MRISNLDGYFEEINEIIEELKENNSNKRSRSLKNTSDRSYDEIDIEMVKENERNMQNTIEELRNKIIDLEDQISAKNIKNMVENSSNSAFADHNLAGLNEKHKMLIEEFDTYKKNCHCDKLKNVGNAENDEMLKRISLLKNENERYRCEIKDVKTAFEKFRAEVKVELEKNKRTIDEYKLNCKRMKNELVDLKGDIRVFCRIKPSTEKIARIEFDENNLLIKDSKVTYFFDKIFDWSTKQQEIYKEIGYLLESVYEGYQVCIFAYGQTGSGKTYTMEGTEDSRGINFRLLDNLFVIKKILEEDGWTIDIKCTFIEIYNENIYDLFGKDKNTKFGKLDIQHKNNETVVNGIKEIQLTSFDESEAFITQSSKMRSVGATLCNHRSSRSHSIITYKIKMKKSNEERQGTMCLIDLAGSERLDASQAIGDRLKETQCINKSLSNLGNVFTSILNKDSHIPFRNSVLTYFLQTFLSSNTRVIFILNISPNENHINETLCTLRFGYKISKCKLEGIKKNVKKII